MDNLKLLRILLLEIRSKPRSPAIESDLLDLIEAIIENRFIRKEWSSAQPPELYFVLKEAFPGNTHPVWGHLPLFSETKGTNWVCFTRRTDDLKLAWLERQLDKAEIPHRRNGRSFHAPILEVPEDRLNAAWVLLTPVDDNDDDDEMFKED